MTVNNLETLKILFREWYGAISIDELIANDKLIELIQKIEAHLICVTS